VREREKKREREREEGYEDSEKAKVEKSGQKERKIKR
jgi:hypothetical protein